MRTVTEPSWHGLIVNFVVLQKTISIVPIPTLNMLRHECKLWGLRALCTSLEKYMCIILSTNAGLPIGAAKPGESGDLLTHSKAKGKPLSRTMITQLLKIDEQHCNDMCCVELNDFSLITRALESPRYLLVIPRSATCI